MKTKIEKNKGINNLEKFPLHKLNQFDALTYNTDTLDEVLKIREKVYNAIKVMRMTDLNLKYKTNIINTHQGYKLKVCRMK